MRKRLLQFLRWLIRLLEKPSPATSHAEFVVLQVEEKFLGTSGEFKRAQALRMLLNITNASERECAWEIENAVRRCLPQ
jgi:hypothetical protein